MTTPIYTSFFNSIQVVLKYGPNLVVTIWIAIFIYFLKILKIREVQKSFKLQQEAKTSHRNARAEKSRFIVYRKNNLR